MPIVSTNPSEQIWEDGKGGGVYIDYIKKKKKRGHKGLELQLYLPSFTSACPISREAGCSLLFSFIPNCTAF